MTNKNDIVKENSDKKKKYLTLNIEIIYGCVIALLISLVAFFITDRIGTLVIENYLTTEKTTEKRYNELMQSFADYVEKNNVASYDTEQLDAWTAGNDNLLLTIFRENDNYLKKPPKHYYSDSSDSEDNEKEEADDNSLLQGSDEMMPDTSSGESETSDGNSQGDVPEANIASPNGGSDKSPAYSNEAVYTNYDETVYPVNFSDGVYSVTISDYSYATYYDVLSFINILVFILAFFIIMTIFVNKFLKRIKSLSKQVSSVTDGSIESDVSLDGRDEITMLASDVNDMRKALVEKIVGEQKAWKANQELITSISHDIRNPLTTLIGYSEMIANEQYENEEQLKKYVASCRDKSYQLKDLTDEMFGYFLVFGNPEPKVKTDNENARILLEQLLGEAVADLRINDYEVDMTMFTEDKCISVDVMALKRIFDNLFSNILKYADKEKPIVISATAVADKVNIKLSNNVKYNDNPVESTKIGIKTCERLCEALSIDFGYSLQDEVFVTEISIPITVNGEEK